MQKIMIIGAGAVGIAAQMGALEPSCEFVAFEDKEQFMQQLHPEPIEESIVGPVNFSHSFEANYKPRAEEIAWLSGFQPLITAADIMGIKADPHERIRLLYEELSEQMPSYGTHYPKHRAEFTKSRPTPKARKAARGRAKAGRKASRRKK